jgi:hypothetical protein
LIACINYILRPESKELLAIKGISDFAIDKSKNEQQGNKALAKKNSAKFAYELIVHLETNLFSQSITKILTSDTNKSNQIASFKSSDGLYLCSEDGNKEVTCSRSNIGSWERFTYVNFERENAFSLAFNGKYMISPIGTNLFECSGINLEHSEKFEIIGSINHCRIKASDNTFLGIQKHSQLLIKGITDREQAEIFEISIVN